MSNAVASPNDIVVRNLTRREFFEFVDGQSEYDIDAETVKHTETGIKQYDDATPQSRWDWLVRLLDSNTASFVNGKVGWGLGKTHLLQLDEENQVYKNSGYTTLCHKEPSSMRVKINTHIDLSVKALCKFCMDQKRMLTAAKIALEHTN